MIWEYFQRSNLFDKISGLSIHHQEAARENQKVKPVSHKSYCPNDFTFVAWEKRDPGQ